MKNRTALRSYFLSNSIPTETNFHELINSGLNQEEDGIRRAVNGPIELEAQGAGGEMLHLYGSFTDSAALWKIGHKPAVAGAVGPTGLNIADAQASRLFIKAGDGSVGIGTDAPAARLQVVSTDNANTTNILDAQAQNLTQGVGLWYGGIRKTGTDAASDLALDAKGTGRILLNATGGTGNVGIGTTAPGFKLDVAGTTRATTYTFPAPPGDPAPVITARAVPADQGAGTERTELILFHSNDGAPGWEDLITLRAPAIRFQTYNNAAVDNITDARGSNDRLYITPGGSVGIGTTGPAARLQVVSADNSKTTNIFDAQAQNLTYGTGLWYGGVRSTGTNGNNTLALDGQPGGHVVLNSNGGTGNVGIGTTTPTEKMEVAGTVYANGENTGFIADAGGLKRVGFLKYAGREGGIWRANNQDFEIGRVDVTALPGNPQTWTTDIYVAANGNVGIGTSTPSVPLDVVSTFSIDSGGFHYLNNSAKDYTGNYWGPFPVSIRAASTVVAGEFHANSDGRLKTVIGLSDHAADLALLNRLRITDYTMRDRVQFGERTFKKVIAQELEEVFPQAVQKSTGFLPDLFACPTQVQRQGEALLIALPAGLPEAATAGQRLKLIGPTGEVVATLAEAAEAGSQQLRVTGANSLADTPEEVFVFGLEHTDVRTVDYEAVAMLNVSATQALARQVEELHRQNTVLHAQYLTQGTQLDELRAAVPLLQQQVAGLLSQPAGVAQPA